MNDYSLVAYWAFWMGLFFLPTLIAFVTPNQRPFTVGFWNVAIGWTGLGWLFLLYKVFPRHLLIRRRAA